MWIEVILTARDCGEFVQSITPLKIELGSPDRLLVIGRPTRIELVAKKGLRLLTAGHVVFTVAGVHVPVNARIASLLLTPTIEKRDGGDALSLRCRVEKLDVNVLPDFIDATVIHRVNDMLAEHDDKVVWRFAKALERHFTLPKQIESASAIDTHTNWGKVKITDKALVFAVSLDVRAVRSGTTGDADAAE